MYLYLLSAIFIRLGRVSLKFYVESLIGLLSDGTVHRNFKRTNYIAAFLKPI